MEENTLQELEQKLMGLTPEEVIEAMGKKPDVSTDFEHLILSYDNYLPNKYCDGKAIIHIHFDQDKVIKISDRILIS